MTNHLRTDLKFNFRNFDLDSALFLARTACFGEEFLKNNDVKIYLLKAGDFIIFKPNKLVQTIVFEDTMTIYSSMLNKNFLSDNDKI